MSDGRAPADPEEPAGAGLPIERRAFLLLGLAQATGWSDLVDTADAPVVGAEAPGADAARSADPAPKPEPTADFLPPVAEAVSARGLSSDSEFSLDEVATEKDLHGRPVSIRELITPQTPGGVVAESEQWHNWLGDYRRDGRDVGGITTANRSRDDERRQLIGTVASSVRDKFRAVGSGHSHSEAARPDDMFTDLKDLKWLIPPPSDWIENNPTSDGESVDPDHLVRVRAGTTIKWLNRGILPPQGLALRNMGSWDGQTLGGAINTSTHGTGIKLGSLADVVRSVEIITVPEAPTAEGEPLVRMLRVEPGDGITDPVAFAQDTHSHDMALIQHDDIFNSIVVGYGSMGVVYAYTIECMDAYWLEERVQQRRWSHIDPANEAPKVRHYNVLVDLAMVSDQYTTNPVCRVKRRTLTAKRGRSPTERTGAGDSVEDALRRFPARIYNAVRNKAVSTLSPSNIPMTTGLPPNQPKPLLPTLPAQTTPFENNRHASTSHVVLRRTEADYPDHHDRPPDPPPDVLTTEIGVHPNDVQAAVDDVIDHVLASSRWFFIPIGIRFARDSDFYLSPEYDRKTAMIEVGIPVLEDLRRPQTPDLRKAKAALEAIGQDHLTDIGVAKGELEKIEATLVDKYDGRPHMGKHNTVNTRSSHDYLKPSNMYPEYDKWLETQRYCNRFGTFDGDFIIHKTPWVAPAPGN